MYLLPSRAVHTRMFVFFAVLNQIPIIIKVDIILPLKVGISNFIISTLVWRSPADSSSLPACFYCTIIVVIPSSQGQFALAFIQEAWLFHV